MDMGIVKPPALLEVYEEIEPELKVLVRTCLLKSHSRRGKSDW